MHIVFVTTAHNTLSQRLAIEFAERGHTIAICLATSAQRVIDSADLERPHLIVGPMVKSIIPEYVWRAHTCLVVHPGIKGDRARRRSIGQFRWTRIRGACAEPIPLHARRLPIEYEKAA